MKGKIVKSGMQRKNKQNEEKSELIEGQLSGI